MNLKLPNNKWFYAFAVATLLFIAAAVVAIVIGVSSGKDNGDDTPEAPEYTEGAETGVYYYDVQDDEVVLTLSGGNNFTITSTGLNKTGTYTADENGNLTLDFLRDEDGTTTATLSGNTLKLLYNNATMTFLKKVNYNVTFDVDGGSEIASATVLNGKTVAEPAEPTKNGFAFIGWYTDASFDERYEFATTAITANTTVYARWAKLTVGESVYTVDFDLGYDGAPEYPAVTTIGGNVYNVPTPTREGYKFVGWYVSMYEDAAKLSYAYTESTKFTADTTLFAVWESTSASLSAPQASVGASAISWSPVAGATSYTVTVTDKDGSTVLSKSVGTTSESFSFAELAAGEYVVTVTAVKGSESSETCTRYYANKTLDRVSGFTVVDGILAFAPVAGATNYTLNVDCGNAMHDHSNFNNGASTTFDLSSCGMKVGGIKVTVTASAQGYASSTSKVFVYDRTLGEVGELVYSPANDRVVWNAVAGAVYYTVTVENGEETYTFRKVTANYFTLGAYTGETTVTVVPVTAGYNSPEAATVTFTKLAPATPTGITVNGTTISWNAAEGAESYEVKIGDKSTPVDGTSVEITSLIQLTASGKYEISVKAVKGSESSLYSAPVTFGYRTMSHDLTYKNGVVYWPAVIGLSDFEVRVNGGEAVAVSGATSLKVTLTKAGVNLIEVRCVADRETTDWASLEVFAYEVTYMSRTTQGELTEYVAIGDALALPEVSFTLDGYDFDGWYTAPEGNGVAASEVFDGNRNLVLYAKWAPKNYTIKLNLDDDKIVGAEEGATVTATYNRGFHIPPVESLAEYTDNLFVFIGWFTGPSGTGTQLTDENGDSLVAYTYLRDSVAYPGFAATMTFTLQQDDTYAVSKATGIGRATTITIPETYEGKPVTVILENGFASCKKLLSVNIPNTIRLVGANAFDTCTALREINVYGDENPDAVYSSFDGALIRKDMGQTWLEMFPAGKIGDYIIPEGVTAIRNKAFDDVIIETVTVGKDVVNIPDYAFYDCDNLKLIYFEGERSYSVAISAGAFYSCDAIESVRLPYAISLSPDVMAEVFSGIASLKEIEVEAKPASGDQAADGDSSRYYYASVDGMLVGATDGFLYLAPPAKEYGETFTIPDGITDIYSGAFYGASVDEVVIPALVKSVGENAFSASSLSKVTFANNRINDLAIDKQAFAGCAGLEAVVFEANTPEVAVTGKISVGEEAFLPAEDVVCKLATVTIGDGVNVSLIGARAFAGQTKLTEIVYGENSVVTEIGEHAFDGCTGLTAIDINAGVTKIGDYAFNGCENASKVEFLGGSNAISFGKYIFNDCTKLTTVKLPATLTKFDGSAFNGCLALKTVEVAEGNANYKNDENGILYNSDETELIFYPKALISDSNGTVTVKEGVTTISASAFKNANGLKTVVLPSTLTVIGAEAFAKCAYLESVTFTAGTAGLTIGDGAFAECDVLTNTGFAIPARTVYIGDKAFFGAKFVNANLPDGLTFIGDEAFAKNEALVSVSIPGTVTYVGDGAFAGCYELATVELKEGTATLEIGSELAAEQNGVFYNCKKLTAITLPARTTTVGAYAFVNTAITSVNIPKNVTVIGAHAFEKGTEAPLTAITFEQGGTAPLTIGEYAFAGQNGVTELVLPYRTAEIGGVATFNDYDYATAYSVFYGMTALKSISFGAKVDGVDAAYASVDGVLYQLDDNGVASTLLYCPASNEGTAPILGEEDAVVGYELVIPNYVTLVANGAIHDVSKLTKITFQEFDKTSENYGKPLLNLGAIDALMSTGDSSIKAVVFPYELMVIGGKFTSDKKAGTNSITAVSLPSHLNTLNAGALGITKDVLDVTFNEDSAVTLATFAFLGSRVKNITINMLADMAPYAIQSTMDVEEVRIVDAAEKFAEWPYYGLNLYDSVYNSITKEYGKYYNPTSNKYQSSKLKKIYVPDTVTRLGDYSFYGSQNLEEVVFEDASKITYLGYMLFYSNSAMKAFPFEQMVNLESTDEATFWSCRALEKADFSNCVKLTEIGRQFFSGCAALTTLILPPNLKSLGTGIAQSIGALTTVHLPKTFTADMLVTPFFNWNEGITTVTIDPDNPELTQDEFGAIYDKEMTILYYFPAKGDIVNYKFPETVTTIGTYAFSYADLSALDTVGKFVIPEGIEKIERYAFDSARYNNYGGSGFDLYLPSTLEVIGDYAFYSATFEGTLNSVPRSAGIINVYITDTPENPSKLKTIGSNAFASCSLRSINLPDSLTSLGTYAFDRAKLTSIIIPAGVTEIPSRLFGGLSTNSTLKSVTLQNGLESIGANAFASCTALTEFVIPSTVVSIGNNAFSGCTGIATVTIPEDSKLESIGDTAFKGTGISELYFPVSLKALGKGAFNGCTKLESVDLSKTKVTELLDNTFNGASSLTSVQLPAKLTVIGASAFVGTAITEIELPEALTEIGEAAFSGSNITAIAIPDAVESISNGAFENAKALESVTFGAASKLKYLGEVDVASNIFKGTTALKTVVLSKNLEVIGDSVFEGSGVESVTFAESDATAKLTSVGNGAFRDCENLVAFNLLETVAYIGEYAFYNCSVLEYARPAIGLKFFGAMAFGNCVSLKADQAYIPQTTAQMTGNPYVGCKVEVSIDDGNQSLNIKEGIVYDASGFTLLIAGSTATGNITLPDDVFEISSGAFAGTKITGIKIPARITVIEDYTFQDCALLENVVFENGVEHIGSYAFEGCTKLNNVTVPNSVDTFGEYAFANCTSLSNFEFEDKDVNDDDEAYNLSNAKGMFFGCSALTEVVMPNKHTDAFFPESMFEATGIVNAVIPADITDLKTAAVFKNCKSLKTVEFEAEELTNATIGGYLFYGCSALETIEIPYRTDAKILTCTDGYAFAECTSLESATFTVNEHVKYTYSTGFFALFFWNVGQNCPSMFENCSSLEEVNVKFRSGNATDGFTYTEGYLYAGNSFFKGCSSLKYADLSYWTYAYSNAFEGATSLGDITIDTPILLGEYAFKDCTNSNAYFMNVAKTVKIKYGTRTKSYNAAFGKGLFSGWTEDQSIFFVNNTEAEITEWFGTDWLEGCEAKVYYKDDLAEVATVDIDNFEGERWNNELLKAFTAVTTLNVGNVHGTLVEAQFADTAFTTVKFTAYGHAELKDILAGKALSGCTATVLDKDGNQLVYDATENTLTVLDGEGNEVTVYDYNPTEG